MEYSIEQKDIEVLDKCCICGQPELHVISEVHLQEVNGLNFLSTVLCGNCGHVFRNIRPKLSWFLEKWANRNESGSDNKKINLNSKMEKRRYFRYKNLANMLEQFSSDKKILDIGTGTGAGLKAFKDREWEVTGLEPDPQRALFGINELGLNILMSAIEDFYPKKQYPFIMMVHVLEHIHFPLDIVAHISRLLQDGGYCYLEVPNRDNFIWWKDSLYMEHMNNFSFDTLSLLGRKHDLEVVFRVFPKTGPHGKVHLGLVFRKQKISIAETFDGENPNLLSIRKLYCKGLFLKKKVKIKFVVPSITNLCQIMTNIPYPFGVLASYCFFKEGKSFFFELLDKVSRILIADIRNFMNKVSIRLFKKELKDKAFEKLKFKKSQ